MELSQKYHLLVFAKKSLIVLGIGLSIVLVILLVGFLTGKPKPLSLYGQEQLPTDTSEKTLVKNRLLGDYLKIFKERNIFTPKVATLKQILDKVKWDMRLTATIIDPNPNLSAAFIIDKNAVEEIYYEGDLVGPWKIKSILQDKVVLEDGNGNEMILRRDRSPSIGTTRKSSSSTRPGQLETKEVLSEFAKLDGDEIIRRLKPIIKSMSPEVVLERIEDLTGISKEEIPKDADLSEYVGDLIRLSQDGALEPAEVFIALSLSTNVNPDNSPQNQNTIFAETDKRIYACFANQGELKGLKNIIVRWIDTANGTNIYTGNKTINAVTPWNYVWLEKKSGWQKGSYSVQLLKTSAPGKVVAQGAFDIR